MNKEQCIAVLKVLNNIKTCVDNNNTFIPGVGDCHNQDENYVSPFNLHKSFGICWHVFAHTPGELNIHIDSLSPVFIELGYKSNKFPVEKEIYPELDDDSLAGFRSNYDLYLSNNVQANVRYKLLCELIKYFENKLK